MSSTMLTTTDNPYSPFTQFDEWRNYDERSGYYSLAMLARIVKSSEDLSESDQDVAIEDAINQVVEQNVLGVWRKVNIDDFPVVFDPLV